MKKSYSRGLMFWFTLLFVIFTIVILAVSGIVTYFSEMSNYKTECEKNIRNIGEYLATLMKGEGEDVFKYREFYMDHYREMRIDYGFDSCEEARLQFVKLFSKEYPGQALGVDVRIEDTTPEIQMAYYTYKHEYWLLTFEKARKVFNIPYSYFLVMGDERGRIESLKPDQDYKQSVVYMIDGERTLDEENSVDGKKYLYLGDTYYNGRDDYRLLWSTWETGVKQDGYMEWDNEWGHTYGYYTPLVINGKKIGLIATEIDVATVNSDIMANTFRLIGIIGCIFIVGLVFMLILIRVRFIRRAKRLEDAMRAYSETKDPAIAGEYEKAFQGSDEISVLGRGFISMIREVEDHMKKMIRANRQLEVSRKREHEMSELAVRDSLTGIRNKTAYEREVYKIKREIESGATQFGIVMVDLDNLKRINDTFGHEKGNIAIKNVCGMICETFAHSPVFRVGGDEFVIIVKNNDYEMV
ncbi:MAG: diguanylate cyclase, partial [Eubacterium sp.]|nr:diguanylate cyclase [Eubacterium sp.]